MLSGTCSLVIDLSGNLVGGGVLGGTCGLVLGANASLTTSTLGGLVTIVLSHSGTIIDYLVPEIEDATLDIEFQIDATLDIEFVLEATLDIVYQDSHILDF